MKSAYELAMERLEKQSPAVKVTDEMRRALAEIDASYKAKIAEREVFLNAQIAKASRRAQSPPRWMTSACNSRVRCAVSKEECEAKKEKERRKAGKPDKGLEPELL